MEDWRPPSVAGVRVSKRGRDECHLISEVTSITCYILLVRSKSLGAAHRAGPPLGQESQEAGFPGPFQRLPPPVCPLAPNDLCPSHVQDVSPVLRSADVLSHYSISSRCRISSPKSGPGWDEALEYLLLQITCITDLPQTCQLKTTNSYLTGGLTGAILGAAYHLCLGSHPSLATY